MQAYCCVYVSDDFGHILCTHITCDLGTWGGRRYCCERPNLRFTSLLVADNDRVSPYIVYLPLWAQWRRWYVDVANINGADSNVIISINMELITTSFLRLEAHFGCHGLARFASFFWIFLGGGGWRISAQGLVLGLRMEPTDRARK